MRIQNNIMAMNTHRMYTINNNNVSKSAEKLSSGYRINRAGDDAAGLAISEKMRAQVRGLNMASKNSQDAISLIQTAEGALQEVHSMLQRMNELSNQAATGTNQTFDRQQINAEFNQLKNEINDISDQTTFNNMKLLDGSLSSGAAKVQVDSTSAIQAGVTLNEFTITSQSGLSDKVGTYTVTAGDGTNGANVGEFLINFTDTATGDQTNTVVDIAKAISGNFVAGGAFKLDLSAAGMGVFEMTSDDTAIPTTASLAAALTTQTMTTNTNSSATTPAAVGGITGAYTPSSTAPAGTYTLKASGSDVIITDQDGNTATVAASAITAVATDEAMLDMTAVTLGGKVVDLGKFDTTATGHTAATAAEVAASFDGVVITGNAGSEGKGGLKIQVGANEGEQLTISVEKMNVQGLGLTNSSIADQDSASKAITATQNAINLVSEQRATLGAMQNRLEHKISNLDNTSENLSSAESRIRDVDIAKEMTNYTKNNILSQASTAMLAQANSAPQNVLSLLQ